MECPGTTAAEPLLEARELSMRFEPQVVALREVSLKLHAGEFLVILGPSGL